MVIAYAYYLALAVLTVSAMPGPPTAPNSGPHRLAEAHPDASAKTADELSSLIATDPKNKRKHINECRDYLLSSRDFAEARRLDKLYGIDEPIFGARDNDVMNVMNVDYGSFCLRVSKGENPIQLPQGSLGRLPYERKFESPSLLVAIEQDDIKFLKRLLEFGVDPRPANGEIDFIDVAHKKGRLDMVSLLFDFGAYSGKLLAVMSSPDDAKLFSNVRSKLGPYVGERKHSLVQDLIDEGTPTTFEYYSGWTTLEIASENKDLRMVRLLMQGGFNFKAKKMRSLHAALSDLEILKYLWPEKMHQDQIDNLFAAACLKSQDTQLLDFLLDKGANINGNPKEDLYTPLMYSMVNYRKDDGELRYDNAEAFDYLIEHGADHNARNREGMTPIMMAAFLGMFQPFQKLVERGVDLHATSNDGQTVFDMVKRAGNLELKYWNHDGALHLIGAMSARTD